MIDAKTINRILLARRLYEFACDHLKSEIDISLSIGVNLLQDSVEVFLIAIAAYVQADIGDRTQFDQYFDAINKKTGNILPLRARLNDINKLRVNSKHRGLAPAKSEVIDLPIIVKAFFEEVSSSLLECHFSSINLIDLMRDAVYMIEITKKPISVDKVIDSVQSDSSGCVVTYIGLIRNNSQGRPVLTVEYEDSAENAKNTLQDIADETGRRWQIENIALSHRIGTLRVGEINLIVAVASAHRKEGFAACRYAVDKFKQRLPTRKTERYQDIIPLKDLKD